MDDYKPIMLILAAGGVLVMFGRALYRDGYAAGRREEETWWWRKALDQERVVVSGLAINFVRDADMVTPAAPPCPEPTPKSPGDIRLLNSYPAGLEKPPKT